MRALPRVLALFVAFFLLGCATSKKVQSEAVVKSYGRVTFASALKLEKRKQYMAALKQYSQIIETAETRLALHKAVCGKARCLGKIGKLKLAFSSLAPLSDLAGSPADCEKLALAGELLLCMRKFQTAESTLEVALDGVRENEKKYAFWTAPASANLGNAYLRNGKLKQAQIMFSKAAKLFDEAKKPIDHAKCLKILLSLKQLEFTKTKE